MNDAEKLDWLAGLNCETCGGKGFNHPEYICPDCEGKRKRCWEVLEVNQITHRASIWPFTAAYYMLLDGALQAICKRLGWECGWVNDEWQGWGWMVSSEWADTLLDAVYRAMGGEE